MEDYVAIAKEFLSKYIDEKHVYVELVDDYLMFFKLGKFSNIVFTVNFFPFKTLAYSKLEFRIVVAGLLFSCMSTKSAQALEEAVKEIEQSEENSINRKLTSLAIDELNFYIYLANFLLETYKESECFGRLFFRCDDAECVANKAKKIDRISLPSV